MKDDLGRPRLLYAPDYREANIITYKGVPGYHGSLRVEGSYHGDIFTIVRATARQLCRGMCFGVVSKRGDGTPCIHIMMGDIDRLKVDAHGNLIDWGLAEEHQIHPGNYPHESDGCPMPGMQKLDTGVGYSQLAMDELFRSLVLAESYGYVTLNDMTPSYANPPWGLVIVVDVQPIEDTKESEVVNMEPAPVKPSWWAKFRGLA